MNFISNDIPMINDLRKVLGISKLKYCRGFASLLPMMIKLLMRLVAEAIDCPVQLPPYTRYIDSMPVVRQLDLSRVSHLRLLIASAGLSQYMCKVTVKISVDLYSASS